MRRRERRDWRRKLRISKKLRRLWIRLKMKERSGNKLFENENQRLRRRLLNEER